MLFTVKKTFKFLSDFSSEMVDLVEKVRLLDNSNDGSTSTPKAIRDRTRDRTTRGTKRKIRAPISRGSEKSWIIAEEFAEQKGVKKTIESLRKKFGWDIGKEQVSENAKHCLGEQKHREIIAIGEIEKKRNKI